MYKVQRKREGSFAVELHGVSLIIKEITIKEIIYHRNQNTSGNTMA